MPPARGPQGGSQSSDRGGGGQDLGTIHSEPGFGRSSHAVLLPGVVAPGNRRCTVHEIGLHDGSQRMQGGSSVSGGGCICVLLLLLLLLCVCACVHALHVFACEL